MSDPLDNEDEGLEGRKSSIQSILYKIGIIILCVGILHNVIIVLYNYDYLVN